MSRGPSRKYDYDKIVELRNQGKSVLEVSDITGIHKNSVGRICKKYPNYQKIYKRDINTYQSRQLKNKTRDADIIAMRKQGVTLEHIGKKYGITKERVRQICIKAGYDTIDLMRGIWQETLCREGN